MTKTHPLIVRIIISIVVYFILNLWLLYDNDLEKFSVEIQMFSLINAFIWTALMRLKEKIGAHTLYIPFVVILAIYAGGMIISGWDGLGLGIVIVVIVVIALSSFCFITWLCFMCEIAYRAFIRHEKVFPKKKNKIKKKRGIIQNHGDHNSKQKVYL